MPIVGDAKEVIADLIAALQAEHEAGRAGDYDGWWAPLDQLRDHVPARLRRRPTDGSLAPQYVIERLGAHRRARRRIYAAGVGQHQMWAAQFIKYERPGTWLNSGGARHDGLRGAGRDGRQGRRARTPPSGRSTATAASR